MVDGGDPTLNTPKQTHGQPHGTKRQSFGVKMWQSGKDSWSKAKVEDSYLHHGAQSKTDSLIDTHTLFA